MPKPTPKDRERADKLRRVKEEFPLPLKGGSIKDVDVLSTDAVVLEGVFDLEQVEAVAAHMRALRS